MSRSYKRFLILTSPRCGTHMLCSALAQHPGIVSHSEVFNPDYGVDAPIEETTPEETILNEFVFYDYPSSIDAVGFALHRSGARFGRWGKVRQGLAVRCSADRGIYGVGETIKLTVRVRRVGAGEPMEPFLVVSGFRDGDGRLEKQRIPIPDGGPGPEAGGEATREVEVLRKGGIGTPGLYRLYVRGFVRGEKQFVVEAAPIELRIR